MFKDRLSLFILFRVLILVLVCLLFAFLFGRPEYLFSQIITGILIIILTIELTWFTRKTARDLSRFLLAIRHGDGNMSFSDNRLSPVYRDLSSAFQEVLRAIRNVKTEKEAKFQLLQAIIDRMDSGIITYNSNNEILLMNQSAGILLGTGKVSDWAFIKKQVPGFSSEVEEMGNEGRKLITIEEKNESVQLSAGIHHFTLLDQSCKLVTFQDIRNEIEQKEIEAWYKLIRILTHEIMNSVTPLESLTDTILMILEGNNKQKPARQLTENNIADIRSSVTTIRERSEGILQFVEDYRKLTGIPHPETKYIPAGKFLKEVAEIMKPGMDEKGIRISIEWHPEELVVMMDKNLMEQVLINLLTNSLYALEKTDDPLIHIKAGKERGLTFISVGDNGKGIPADKMDKIFIPFYSTREGGSGIGLSFSKQVVYMHHGRIRVTSEYGKGTVFTIHLPESTQ